MVELIYRVVCNVTNEQMRGMEGFFQIKINGNTYGEIYPRELEDIMDKVSVYDWFERLLRVTKKLQEQTYIILSDTESYNRWIEFIMNDEDIVTVSIIKAEKIIGSQDIEYVCPDNKEYVEWDHQRISYVDLKEEIINKSSQYVEVLLNENDNLMSAEIQKLIGLIVQLQSGK